MFQEILHEARQDAIDALMRRVALLDNLRPAAATARQRALVRRHRIRAIAALWTLGTTIARASAGATRAALPRSIVSRETGRRRRLGRSRARNHSKTRKPAFDRMTEDAR